MLLSAEFLQTARHHMNEGGVLAFNSTYSPDAYKTAASVFEGVYQFGNFVVAGAKLNLPNQAESIRRISALQLNGKPLVDVDDPKVMHRLHTELDQFKPYNEAEMARSAGRPLQVITDQNMITEYRFGESVFSYLGKKRVRKPDAELALTPR